VGVVGDRRRARHRTAALAVGLAVLVVGLATVGVRTVTRADRPDPPPPLPAMPTTTRSDVEVQLRAQREDGGVRVRVAVEVERGGNPIAVRVWDDRSVVGERLPGGQVVLHLGLAGSRPPEGRDELYPHAAPQPPPPAMVLPERRLDTEAWFGGDGAEVDGVVPAGPADVRRIDEVRVCVWSRHDAVGGGDHPAACADDDV
jgi:hypothetical protein